MPIEGILQPPLLPISIAIENAQAPAVPCIERGSNRHPSRRNGTLFDPFRKDVLAGTLPQVSWIVAPGGFIPEHPELARQYMAPRYISQILDALHRQSRGLEQDRIVFSPTLRMTASSITWCRRQFPARGRKDCRPSIRLTRYFGNSAQSGNPAQPGGPYGVIPRVPMIVISPWSRGGWVNSELFDHTSLIRFIEKRALARQATELRESNITPWRRGVAGGPHSAFNFTAPDDAGLCCQALPPTGRLNRANHPDYSPSPFLRAACAAGAGNAARAGTTMRARCFGRN